MEFLVLATSRFDRELKKLAAHHRELVEHYRGVLAALQQDPHNRSRRYPIKKCKPATVNTVSGRAAFDSATTLRASPYI